MGIKSLWSIIDCSGETLDLKSLRGQCLAIDLAGWAVANKQCRGMANGKVAKPHLRNIFFRTTAMIELGIVPVFVMDGAAPELKRETMAMRKEAETGIATQASDIKISRTRLKSLMNECKFLLGALGLQCVQSEGEGEALCARLNSAGLVDAVISDDSDAFGYGANTVLRNFSISAKAYSADRFTTTKLTHKMGLSRDRILLMSILLGCDFFPAGVSGIGKESVMQMIDRWPRHWDALGMLKFWIKIKFEAWIRCFGECLRTGDDKHCAYCELWRDCQPSFEDFDCICSTLSENKELLKIESTVKKKCAKVDQTWWIVDYPKIIAEFSNTSEELPDLRLVKQLSCPKVSQCLSILVRKLGWEEKYALDTLIPVLTRWQLKHLCSGGNIQVVEPFEILKKRVVGGVPNLNVYWRVLRASAEETKGLPESFESCDPTEMISNAYPELYENYVAANEKPKKAPRKKAAPATTRTKKKTALQPDAAEEQTQKPITQFFSQKKKASTPKVIKRLPGVFEDIREEEEEKEESFRDLKENRKQEGGIDFQNTAGGRCNGKENMEEKEEELSSFEDSECSDLSLIIDDILSKKVGVLTVANRDQPAVLKPLRETSESSSLLLPFTTSTPTSYRPRTKLRACLPGKNSIVPQNLHKQVLESNRIDRLAKSPAVKQVPTTPKIYAHKNPREAELSKTESPDLFDLSEEDSFDRMCK